MKNGHTTAAKGPGGPLRPAGRAARAGSGQHDAVPCLLGHDVPVRHLDGLVRGNAGASVAADHLLGVHSAVRLLRAALGHRTLKRGVTGVCCRGTGHGGDAGLHAGGPGGVRCADLSGQRHAADRCAGTAAEKDPARRRAWRFRRCCLHCTYHLDERWAGRASAGWQPCVAADAWYANYFTAFFGFLPFDWFYSTDYFALLPWLFLFWAGYYLHKRGGPQTRWNRCAARCARRWAGWAGTRFCCICCTSR